MKEWTISKELSIYIDDFVLIWWCLKLQEPGAVQATHMYAFSVIALVLALRVFLCTAFRKSLEHHWSNGWCLCGGQMHTCHVLSTHGTCVMYFVKVHACHVLSMVHVSCTIPWYTHAIYYPRCMCVMYYHMVCVSCTIPLRMCHVLCAGTGMSCTISACVRCTVWRCIHVMVHVCHVIAYIGHVPQDVIYHGIAHTCHVLIQQSMHHALHDSICVMYCMIVYRSCTM